MPDMLRNRLIFGPVLIAVLIAVFYVDNRLDQLTIRGTIFEHLFFGRAYLPAGLLLLVCIVSLIAMGAGELCSMFRAKEIEASPVMMWLSGTIGAVLIYMIPSSLDSQTTMAIYATAMVVIFILSLIRYAWRSKRTRGAVIVAAVTMFTMIYMGIFPGFYLAIRRWHSAWIVAGILLITKACDIGAYFTGKAIGRHKLIPWLSPGKTWEGLAGGMAMSGMTAVGLTAWANAAGVAGHWAVNQHKFIPQHYPLWFAAIAGVIIGVVGQAGDLTASLFKRDAGFKDSGQILPGFGGIIDIADSPIIVAPVAYWLLQLLQVLSR